MGQESDSDLGPFKLFVDLVTEANDILPVFLAVRRVGSFIQPGLQALPYGSQSWGILTERIQPGSAHQGGGLELGWSKPLGLWPSTCSASWKFTSCYSHALKVTGTYVRLSEGQCSFLTTPPLTSVTATSNSGWGKQFVSAWGLSID